MEIWLVGQKSKGTCMVKLQQFSKSVYLTYNKTLGKNICLLVIGGSIGRENYIEGWSDADLLLILNDINSQSLQLIKRCEKRIGRLFSVGVDTMVSSKYTIEHTPPEKLHGKIKNFLFFLPKEKVLIQRNLNLPIMDNDKFAYGFWATYAEQEKNFLRRNADINIKDKKALQVLFRKNIKIIFLIIKQRFATSVMIPLTYREAISLTEDVLPLYLTEKLKEYEMIRINNKLSTISIPQLKKEISRSVEIFRELGKIVIKRIN